MPIVIDVDDIAAPVAALLATADVDRRHAEVGTFTDRHARVADDAAATVEQLQEFLRREVLEEVDRQVPVILPERPDRLGGAVGTGIDVGPEPEGRQAAVANGVKGLLHMGARFTVFGRHRVLHDHDVAAGKVHLLADPAVFPVDGREIQRRPGDGLPGDVDGGAAGYKDRLPALAHADDPCGRLFRGHEMQVGQLGHGVPHLLIDGAGDLPPWMCSRGMFI